MRVGVSLILLRRVRPGIALRMFWWVCVYAPMWPGISFWRYPFLDLRLEKWGGGWRSVKKREKRKRNRIRVPSLPPFVRSYVRRFARPSSTILHPRSALGMVASLSDYSLVLSDPCHSATQSAVSSTSTRCASIFRFHFRRFSLPLWGAPVCAGFRCLFFGRAAAASVFSYGFPQPDARKKKEYEKKKSCVVLQ